MKCELLTNSMTQLTMKVGPGKVNPITHHYFMDKIISNDQAHDIRSICEVDHEGIKQGRTVFAQDKKQIDYKYNNYYKEQVPHAEDIIQRVVKQNETTFGLNIDCMMKFQYIIYDKDSHFDWHPDGPFSFNLADGFELPEGLTYRKLTLVVMLTPHEEYEGGEFLLFDPQAHPQSACLSFKMDIGEAILFPSFLMHKVNPVISGQRRTLVAWFCGPRWT